jgi:hypothetical protein
MTISHRRAVALAAVAAVLAAVGCNAITSSGDRVVLATSINPSAFASGDTTLIGVTINNIALTTATIEAVTCETLFEVFDAQGNVVGPGPIDDCGTLALPASIQSGQAFTLAAAWTGTATGSTAANPTYLAPGTYRIRGKATIRELGIVTGRTVTIQVTE